MDRQAYHLVISGVVQGVGFRYFTRQEALSRGLQGTVVNLASGQVEIYVEGSKPQLEAFLQWCQVGPQTATVEQVDCNAIEAKGFSDFTILR